MFWADSISEACTGCRWINYSSTGGWYLTIRDLQCPVHGDEPRETKL